MDPLQYMGAVRIRVQTSDKNITKTSRPSVNEMKMCVFVRNKSIIKALALKYHFWPKYHIP